MPLPERRAHPNFERHAASWDAGYSQAAKAAQEDRRRCLRTAADAHACVARDRVGAGAAGAAAAEVQSDGTSGERQLRLLRLVLAPRARRQMRRAKRVQPRHRLH